MLLRGDLEIDAKNSNFEIFESILYMKAGSIPLMVNSHIVHFSFKIILFFLAMYAKVQNGACVKLPSCEIFANN